MKIKKPWLGMYLLIVIIAIVMLIVRGVSGEDGRQKVTTVTQKVTTVIQEEEFQFYSDIVQKEYKGKDENELYERVEKYAREVYAQFALGREYGLCKPYSYEALKMEVEAENQQRKAKDDAGEVVYGVLEYSTDGYLIYTLNNLRLKIVDYLVKNYDNDLEKEARKYLDNNPYKFQSVESVKYSLGDETKTVSRLDLPTLEKTNSELFEYLYNGKEGDTFSIVLDEKVLDGEILSKEIDVVDFEEDKQIVLRTYISDFYYWQLVDNMAETNLLEFELNKE